MSMIKQMVDINWNKRKLVICIAAIQLTLVCTAQSTAPPKKESDSCDVCPLFAVRLPDGQSKIFVNPHYQSPNTWRFTSDILDATITFLGQDQWQLDIQNKHTRLIEVWFPWQKEETVLGNNESDYFMYYPYLLGTMERNENLGKWEWQGSVYPGAVFAPLIIIADENEAVITAAVNWPARRVKPLYSRGRAALVYDDIVEVDQKISYRLLCSLVKGDANKGIVPWQLAIDKYGNWLHNKMADEKLSDVNCPEWLEKVNGFISVQLENFKEFDIAKIYEIWNRWHDKLPWIQFWGQMSEYAGNPGGGCCLEKITMHPRYGQALIVFARNVTTQSPYEGHVGYYSRPHSKLGLLTSGGQEEKSENLAFLLEWFKINRQQYCANVFYIDALGGGYFGDPVAVARLFRDVFPKSICIEYPVDLYPTAFVASGSLGGFYWNRKEWAKDITDLGKVSSKCAFPRFGRYLLSDRIMFLGESNGDHVFWGHKSEYWVERQAFLLGAKFDAVHVQDGPDAPDEMNHAMALCIAERERTSWWERKPKYADTKGLYNIPNGIRVTRFVDKDGKNLLAIDNWHQSAGLKFNFNSKTIDVPVSRLSIVETSSN